MPYTELPFELPEGWEWCRFSEIGEFTRGNGIKRNETTASGVKCVRYGEIYTTYNISFKSAVSHTSPEVAEKAKKLSFGDILLTLTGENKEEIGKSVAFLGEEETVIGGDLAMFKHRQNPMYLSYFLNSPYAIQCKALLGTGDIIVHISCDKLGSILFPLPPLAEQHRIVAKIEELLPHIGEYEKKEQSLHTLLTIFPEKLKKSILQEAVQGKLVPQDPSDEPASVLLERIGKEKERLIKEGKIKADKKCKTSDKITYTELPFELPAGWVWCRMSDYIDVRDGTHDTPKYVSKGIPLVTSKNLINGDIDFSNIKYISEDDHKLISNRSQVDNGDILFAMIGSIGNPVIVNKKCEFSIKNVALFKPYLASQTNMSFVYYFLLLAQMWLKKQASGGVQAFISLKYFRDYLIPIPPLPEQKRIVAKIEELLPICEKL